MMSLAQFLTELLSPIIKKNMHCKIWKLLGKLISKLGIQVKDTVPQKLELNYQGQGYVTSAFMCFFFPKKKMWLSNTI